MNQWENNLEVDPDLPTMDSERAVYDDLQKLLYETERARQHASLLSRVALKLNSSLEYEIDLAKIAQLTVPLLGDWCLLDMVQENGEFERVHVAYASLDHKNTATRLKSLPSSSFWSTHRNQALSNGKTQILNRTDSSDEFPLFEGYISVQSAMFVPMVLHGRKMGVFTFLSSNLKERFGIAERSLAEEIAYRSAIAIENAWLYSEAKSAISVRDEFFSIVSHELRTPMTALSLQIQLISQMMEEVNSEIEKKEKVQSLLHLAHQSTKKLSRLVDDFMDISSIRINRLSICPTLIDLSEVVRGTIAQVSALLTKSKCQLTLELASPCHGFFDKVRMEQVLINLLSNAMKYCSGQPIHVSLMDDDSTVELRIQDFGPGIPLKDQTRIFGLFERSEKATSSIRGLGLGLYITQGIVRSHSGSIQVESQLGSGTTFIIRLPKVRKVEKGEV